MSNEEIKPKILFLSTNNFGVGFYRFYQFAQKMSELNLAHVRLFPDWEPQRMSSPDWQYHLDKWMPTLTEIVGWADFIVCQYINCVDGLCLVEAIKDLKPLFMEVDDNFSGVPYYSLAFDDNKPGERQDFWGTRQALESHGIVTTTEYLRNHYSKWNKNVYVIPNCIDFELWDKYKSHSNERVKIGWIGGATHEGDLKVVKNVLYEILNKYEDVEVQINTVPVPRWEKHDRLLLTEEWADINKYPALFKKLSFDIGIAPLRDNIFNRGKSNLKYLEYSACKIPTVASDVEPFKKDFVGYLANTEEDWYIHLSNLIENLDHRLQMGWNAYYDVKDKFNLNNVAIKYADMVKEQIKWHGQTKVSQVVEPLQAV